MSDDIILNIDSPMLDPNTGKPVRLVSIAKASELGMKTEFEMNQRINEFPESVLGDIITGLFDVVPIPSPNYFSIYSDISKDIRIARQKSEDTIKISKHNLEQFKKIFTEKPPENPANNRKIAFVIECIEISVSKSVVETIPEN